MSQDNKIEVGRLEDDVARTRQNLGRDIEALADKLNPERYRNTFKTQTEQTLTHAQEVIMDTVNEVTDNVTQRAQEAGTSFFDMVRRHPLPTALLSAGVLLLVAGGGVGIRRASDDDDEGYTGYGTRYGYGEGDYTGYVRPGYGDASAATGYTQSAYNQSAYNQSAQSDYQTRGLSGQGYEGYGAYDNAGTSGSGSSTGSSTGSSGTGSSSAGSWLQDEGNDLRDRASSAASQTRAKTRDAERGLAGFIESQPLVAGLITAILGALIGLSLPGTRQEDKLMGDARDNLADQAKDTAERARHVAQKTFDDAKETAKQEFSQVADDAKTEGKNIVEEGKDAAKKVADDAQATAKETAKNESNKQNPN